MKDFMDKYEESIFPGLLEILFTLIIIMDSLLAVWITFMAPLHISVMPYLRVFYVVMIPVSYVALLVVTISIKKAKKYLLAIVNAYLGMRVACFSFFFVNEILYRLSEASANANRGIIKGIIFSGIFCISFTLLFSVIWVILVNASKKIKYHISN